MDEQKIRSALAEAEARLNKAMDIDNYPVLEQLECIVGALRRELVTVPQRT